MLKSLQEASFYFTIAEYQRSLLLFKYIILSLTRHAGWSHVKLTYVRHVTRHLFQ